MRTASSSSRTGSRLAAPMLMLPWLKPLQLHRLLARRMGRQQRQQMQTKSSSRQLKQQQQVMLATPWMRKQRQQQMMSKQSQQQQQQQQQPRQGVYAGAVRCRQGWLRMRAMPAAQVWMMTQTVCCVTLMWRQQRQS
jgi:hypothetical protein